MKKYFTFLISVAFLIQVNAQQPKWMLDNESLLTPSEINRIDSILQHYRVSTGKFIIVCTDTSNVTEQAYIEKIYKKYKDVFDPQDYVYILMLSRKHQTVISNVSKRVMPYINQEKLVRVMEPGFQLLKEQKREEAIIVICKNAMKLLDSLPKE